MSHNHEHDHVHCDEDGHEPHEHQRRSDEQIEAAARLCAAMGEPGRLRLLELLFDGPHCVSELAEEMGDSMSSISQRLKILYQARLVTRNRQGKHVNYALADDHVQTILHQLFAHSAETSA